MENFEVSEDKVNAAAVSDFGGELHWQ